jgi:hypothetical protein
MAVQAREAVYRLWNAVQSIEAAEQRASGTAP